MGTTCTGKQSANISNGDKNESIMEQSKKKSPEILDTTYIYELSRLVACHGIQVQKKLMKMKVFIKNVSGLGIQVVKNLILIGPKEVCIFDKNIITISDVGNNFYLNQSQVQKQTRASGCLKKLKQLNHRVSVTEAQSDNVQYIIQNFNCVVVLDNYDKDYLIKLNEACHKKSIPFILGGNLGLYGYTFVDFGQDHKIFDLSGRQPKKLMIKSISNSKKAEISFHEQDWHGFNDGDKVKIVNVKGMTQLNQKQFQVTINQQNNDIQINIDTTNFNPYINGGQLIEIKKIISQKFKNLNQSLKNPFKSNQDELICADWSKIQNPPQLHALLNSMYQFYAKNKRIPNILDTKDLRQYIQISQNQLQTFKQEMKRNNIRIYELKELNLTLAQNISNFGGIQISACCSFWGGIITQEIIKSTGKYKPIHQWFHHDFIDIIPEIERNLQNITPNRYRDYQILFGKKFVQQCNQSNVFMIGAGALGCEYIKMFALMGIGTTQKNGKIWVTDDDSIQTSNLNRQFLFREHHIGKNKSQTACEIGTHMNSSINFHSLKLRLTSETQITFNDVFWDSLNFVVNAVDNVQARNTIDQKCVFYQKPCFQSGTSGTSCSSQVIIPHLTATYTDIGQARQKQVAPACTIKSFPYKLQHIIPWTKGLFEIIFQTPSQNLIQFCQSKDKFITQLQKKVSQNPNLYKRQLKILKDFLLLYQCNSYQKCLQYFLILINQLFRQKIKKLLTSFPQDFICNQTGKPYWSGVKKCPQVLQFNFNDPYQLNFLKGGANIISDFFHIKERLKDDAIVLYANQVLKNSNQEHSKTYKTQQSTDELINFLKQYKMKKTQQLDPIKFDKDNEKNFHIQFLSAATNLRAKNYKIQQADDLTIKIIAGKIIPAIATTTAMVVGSIGIQIIKYILNKSKANFMNLSANLSISDWSFARPLQKLSLKDKQMDQILACPKKYFPKGFNKWFKIQFQHPKTLGQLNQYFKKEYKMDIYSISSQGINLNRQEIKNLQNMDVKQIFQEKLKNKFTQQKRYLKIQIFSKENGTIYIYPTIKYKLVDK